VPSLVLDTPVAREVYGDAALYVATPEPRAVAAALEQLMFDETTREVLRRAAEPVLARYTWDACAARVLTILESSC
jgi:glycosyltransferase involved in cell wall biosynthesis